MLVEVVQAIAEESEVVEAAVSYCRENIYLWLGLFIGILIGVVATAIIVAIRNDDMRYK